MRYLVCVYFPPLEAHGNNETAWHEELEGLSNDLGVVRRLGDGGGVVMIGDWNSQPPVLSGKADLRPTRGQALECFQREWSLELLNPPLGTHVVQEVLFPLRAQRLMLHPVSIWYASTSYGRNIDLAFASKNLPAGMHIHNGMDCKDSGKCSWDIFVEY